MSGGCGLSVAKRTFELKKARASWALERGAYVVASYDIWSKETRLWWSSPKRERPRCGAGCRDGSPCEAPPVWDKRRNRPVNGRCRMHGGLSTGPKTPQGRWRITESNRARSASMRPDAITDESP